MAYLQCVTSLAWRPLFCDPVIMTKRCVHLAAVWKMRGEVGKCNAELRSLKRERALQK